MSSSSHQRSFVFLATFTTVAAAMLSTTSVDALHSGVSDDAARYQQAFLPSSSDSGNSQQASRRLQLQLRSMGATASAGDDGSPASQPSRIGEVHLVSGSSLAAGSLEDSEGVSSSGVGHVSEQVSEKSLDSAREEARRERQEMMHQLKQPTPADFVPPIVPPDAAQTEESIFERWAPFTQRGLLDLVVTATALAPLQACAVGVATLLVQRKYPQHGDKWFLADTMVSAVSYFALSLTAFLGAFELRHTLDMRRHETCAVSCTFLMLAVAHYISHCGTLLMQDLSKRTKITMALHHLLIITCCSFFLSIRRMHFYACWAGCCKFVDLFAMCARLRRETTWIERETPRHTSPASSFVPPLSFAGPLLKLARWLCLALASCWIRSWSWDLVATPEPDPYASSSLACERFLCPALLLAALVRDCPRSNGSVGSTSISGVKARPNAQADEVVPQSEPAVQQSLPRPVAKALPPKPRFGKAPRQVRWDLS